MDQQSPLSNPSYLIPQKLYNNLLAPPIPTNPLHLAAAALMLPPFPNMETANRNRVDVWWSWQQQPPWTMKTVMTVTTTID